MKTNIPMIAFLLFCAASLASAADFYVSPHGDDANPGSLEKPFASVERAQQAVRQAKAAGAAPTRVYLRGGIYYLPRTLVFDSRDSGMKASPVIWLAYGEDTPIVSGGQELRLTWEPYKDGIYKATVPAGLSTDQLFVNGRRQVMARYPNFDSKQPIYNGYAADAFDPKRVKRWADPRGGLVHAMHRARWGGMHYVIVGKRDDGTLVLEGGWQNNRPSEMHGLYRFVENIFEELDAPGEWFLDGKARTLYFAPPAGVDLATAKIESVRLHRLIEFRGTPKSPARFITLKGLTFRHAARTFMDTKEPLLRSDWAICREGALLLDGAEDCSVEDCFLDQVGGNAVFVNNYNRRITIRGCHIAEAGANGVALVGDRDAARVPRDWNDHSQGLATLDRTPGPKTDNFPAECTVDDCLIHDTGRVEKQTAPVEIDLAQDITVRHCSIYDVPRAGVNIGDGCWGGHRIEFCDVFNTVLETNDHGSLNTWGRDRYWSLSGLDLYAKNDWEAIKDLPRLDVVKTVVICSSRWRCDHGWDIDLDDGSTNYHLYNNLCLSGGIKNREGFFRTVENNIMINNGFHPHVWYEHSHDVFTRNILTRGYAPVRMPKVWGRLVDDNLFADPRALEAAQKYGGDRHSLAGDPMFIDPAKGDYRVREGSPALKLGFKNFPMDQFGVRSPRLRALAKTPSMPSAAGTPTAGKPRHDPRKRPWLGATVKNVTELGEVSVAGLPDTIGVTVCEVRPGSPAASFGLQEADVIRSLDGKSVDDFGALEKLYDGLTPGKEVEITVIRSQKEHKISIRRGASATRPGGSGPRKTPSP
jgi:hypothetical protein